VLVFLDGGCGSCSELHPHLGRWQKTLAERVVIAVIISGQIEAARPLCEEHAIANVLFDGTSERLSNIYRMPGTPSAVALDSEGRIASKPVLGADGIEELVRQAIRRGAASTEPWKQPSPVG
jgi:hypothetical protein